MAGSPFANIIPFAKDAFTPSSKDEGVNPPVEEPATPPVELTGNELWCEDGSHPFNHTGRGRKPRSCPEHRIRATSTGTGTPRGRTKKLDGLKEDLAVSLAKVGKGASFKFPVSSTVMVTRSTNVSDAMVELCKNNTKALKVLETISKAAPASEIGEFLATMTVAVQVDLGRMEPDHWVAGLMGVTEIYDMIHKEAPRSLVQPPAMTGPPQFIPVH